MSRPLIIAIPPSKYSFAKKDEEIFLPTDDLEEFTLTGTAYIHIIDTGAKPSKYVGYNLTSSDNLRTFRKWFHGGQKGKLFYDISYPVGQELKIMIDLEELQSPRDDSKQLEEPVDSPVSLPTTTIGNSDNN